MDETETEELSKLTNTLSIHYSVVAKTLKYTQNFGKNYWKNCGSGWQRYRPTMVFLLFSVADVLFSSA